MLLKDCKIIWELDDVTKKHNLQSSWKKTIIASIDGEICDMYRWFIYKRFGISLNPPLRGAHLTIVNDKIEDFETFDSKIIELKKIFSLIDIDIDLDIRCGPEHLWFRCLAPTAMEIRELLGLGKPHFGFHVTIGMYRESQKYLSDYILNYAKEY